MNQNRRVTNVLSCLIISVLVIISTGGCASRTYIKRAQVAESKNRWDNAVYCYERAYKKSVRKKTAEKLVNSARKNAAYYYYKEAQYRFNHQKGLLDKQKTALVEIGRALEYEPTIIEYIQLENNILNLIEKLSGEIEIKLENIQRLARQKKYLLAFQMCETVLYTDPQNKKANNLKKNLCVEGGGYYRIKAIELESVGRYKSSAGLIEHALTLNPVSTRYQLDKERISKKLKGAELYQSVIKSVERGQEKSTLQLLRQMVQLDSKNKKYQKMLERTLVKHVGMCLATGRKMEALEIIHEINVLGASSKNVLQELSRIEETVVDAIVNSAEKDFISGYPGNSLYTLMWLSERGLLRQRDREIYKNARENAMIYAIPKLSILPFAGLTNNLNEIGKTASISLFNELKDDSSIMCDVSMDVEEEDSGYNNLSVNTPAINKQVSVGSLSGTYLKLTGTVDNYDFHHYKETEYSEKSYISHYVRRINPDYIMYMKRQSERDERNGPEYDSLGEAIVGSIIEALVDAAIDGIMAPQKYIEEPVYRYHKYKIDHHRVKGVVSYTISLVNSQTNTVVMKRQIVETLELEDTYIPGSSIAKIECDPLELSDDSELRQTLFSDAMDKGVGAVVEFLSQLPEIYHKNGIEYSRLGRGKDAREFSVMAVLSSPESTPVSSRLWPLKYEVGFLLEGNNKKVTVKHVDSPDSPLKSGDTILKINGHKVKNPDQVYAFMNRSRAGSLVQITYQTEQKSVVEGFLINPVQKKNKVTSR